MATRSGKASATSRPAAQGSNVALSASHSIRRRYCEAMSAMRCQRPVQRLRRYCRSRAMRVVMSASASSLSGSFSSRRAAMSQPRARSCGVEALSSIRAMRGWQGRAARRRPAAVIRPSSSRAPSDLSSVCACAMCPGGGGVIHGRRPGSLSPQAVISSTIGARSAVSISGSRIDAMRCSAARLQRR